TSKSQFGDSFAFHTNNSMNDSKISVDSDTGTAVQEINPHPFRLRVINPDFYEEDNEPVNISDIQYKPSLNSVISSPEVKHTTIKEEHDSVVVVPPPITLPNSWHYKEDTNSTFSVPLTPASSSSRSMVMDNLSEKEQYMPSVVRKMSKTLVEQQLNYHQKNGLELLPPLEALPPLFTLNESHLLSKETIEEEEEEEEKTLLHSPPQLPQHHPDFLSAGKTPPSVAQQSVNAVAMPHETNHRHEDSQKLETSLKDYSHSQNTIQRPPISHSRTPSLTPSLTPSSIYPTHVHQQQQQAASSRYSKASYSLTNHPDAIKLYRNMAVKTNDPIVQLTYAKYLLEIASMYDEKRRPFRPNLSLTLPTLKQSMSRRDSDASHFGSIHSRRSSIDTHISSNATFNNMRRDSNMTQGQPYDENEEANKRKKRKVLEEEALKFYEIAANEKVPEAMFAVGQYHEQEQDYMTSFQLYEDAASLGLVEALYRIAMINLNGEFGSRRNVQAAIQLLVKASEKSTGTCPEAPYTLGLLLMNDYPNVDMPSELIQAFGGTFAAMTYLEHAAEMGMSAAQFRLGYIYEYGPYGIRINLAKAHEFYEMAANTNNNGYAMLGLSRLYNQGVQAPPEQAEQQSAIFEQDESGWIKTHGRDEDAAFRWCHLAADQRVPDACYLLGWYYEMGIGVPRDYQQAHHYYSKAVKRGNHKEAKARIDLLESLVKHQKNEKKRMATQDKKLSMASKNRDSQCTIM
ncbi:hypothetical protein CU098_003752, partial [Rhizopus stolonifer]